MQRHRQDGILLGGFLVELSISVPVPVPVRVARHVEVVPPALSVLAAVLLMARTGFVPRGDERFASTVEAMLEHCDDLGLLIEEIEPTTNDLLENFPEGLSRLALVGAGCSIAGSLWR